MAPQTSPERAARWPGMDSEAIEYLQGQGYKLYGDWTWGRPTPDHVVTEKEDDAIFYLIEEWDFGGLRLGDCALTEAIVDQERTK